MEYLAITSFVVNKPDGMDCIENFFLQLGADIRKRKATSLSAFVEHPDGFDVFIKVKCYDFEEKYMEITRRCGDALLFHLVYQTIVDYDFDRGDRPSMYLGQICPKAKWGPREEPSTLPPSFALDVNWKRKRA